MTLWCEVDLRVCDVWWILGYVTCDGSKGLKCMVDLSLWCEVYLRFCGVRWI